MASIDIETGVLKICDNLHIIPEIGFKAVPMSAYVADMLAQFGCAAKIKLV